MTTDVFPLSSPQMAESSASRTLCVFCGSSAGVLPSYTQQAEELGALIARSGWKLVFGAGGCGLMGKVSSACLQAGGHVTGIIPEHLMALEVALPGLSEEIVVPDMHTRKRMMFDRADAFCVLPGGFGTLDETFEILTWKQLSLHDKPVVLCDVDGYWRPMVDMVLSMQRQGFIRDRHLGMFSVAETVQDVFPLIDQHYADTDVRGAEDSAPLVTGCPSSEMS